MSEYDERYCTRCGLCVEFAATLRAERTKLREELAETKKVAAKATSMAAVLRAWQKAEKDWNDHLLTVRKELESRNDVDEWKSTLSAIAERVDEVRRRRDAHLKGKETSGV